MENRNIIKNFGYVSRMDNIQAAFLNYKLKFLDKVINKRRSNAEIYKKILNRNYIKLPYENKNEYHTFHTYVIQTKKRNELKNFLLSKGIETSIHYPVPIHLQPASKKFSYKKGDFLVTESQSKQILTLPINENLSNSNIVEISKLINSFLKNKYINLLINFNKYRYIYLGN